MLSDERLAEIRTRVEAATEGPWGICDVPACKCQMIWAGDQESVVAVAHGAHWGEAIGDPWPNQEQSRANRDFVRHSRQDVPDLLAEVERWKGMARNVVEAFDQGLVAQISADSRARPYELGEFDNEPVAAMRAALIGEPQPQP